MRQATGAPEGGRAPRPTSTSPLITPPVDRAHGAATPAKRPLLPRERKGGDNAAVTKGMSRPATIPEPDQTWHPIARMLWDATLEGLLKEARRFEELTRGEQALKVSAAYDGLEIEV